MNPPAVRCGRIAYTNDLPVYAAFDDDAVVFPGSLLEDVPAALNQALLSGALDCSPISSAFYAEHPDAFVLLPDVCIGSRAEVRSICCISNRPLHELGSEPVAVTKDSVTGRALFATICKHWYGFSPTLQDAADPFDAYARAGSPCVLIGDAAIEASFSVPPGSLYDLGRIWHELSGDQMVYAVWAARRDFAAAQPAAVDEVAAALRAALDWGRQHRGRVVARAQTIHKRPAGFYEAYYRVLNYDFDAAAQLGLKNFFDIACSAGVLAQSPALHFIDEVAQGV